MTIDVPTIGLAVLMACAVGCGSDDGSDFTRVPAAAELGGTYDTRVSLNGSLIASTAARVGIVETLVIIELPTDALEDLHLQGHLAAGGVLAVAGSERHPDAIIPVTGTLQVSATPRLYRVAGTVDTIAGALELSMERPVIPPADPPHGAFVLTFRPSIDGSGPTSEVAVSIDTTNGGCSVTGGPEVPDSSGGIVFGGSCAVSPSGAFWLDTRYRTVVPDTSPFGEEFQLVGRLRTTAAGIAGDGRFGLERFPPNADIFGAWLATRR